MVSSMSYLLHYQNFSKVILSGSFYSSRILLRSGSSCTILSVLLISPITFLGHIKLKLCSFSMSLKHVTGSLKVFCGCWIIDMGQMFYEPFWLTNLYCIQDQKSKRCLVLHKRIYDHKGDKNFAFPSSFLYTWIK